MLMLKIKKKFKNFIKNFLPLNLFFYDLNLDKNFHIMQGDRKSFFQETMKKGRYLNYSYCLEQIRPRCTRIQYILLKRKNMLNL
jgi:hypothetical protein